jgi:RNA polymerase sigma factor (TIGR02999 family)
MSRPPASAEVTALLLRWSAGDQEALDRLLPLIYAECRRIAARQLRVERPEHTLTPTALVHEMYLRLVDQRCATYRNRAQFFAIAARIMRRVLVDHARARMAQKRDGALLRVSLDHATPEPDGACIEDVLAIDQALTRLAELDAVQERVVELRYFAGLTVEETAEVLGCSPRTVKREWQLARAWLFRELNSAAP